MMRTYENESTWKTIQSFLPEYNRIDDSCRPVEEYVMIDGFQLHLDHYLQQDRLQENRLQENRFQEDHVQENHIQEVPKGIVAIFHGVGGNGRLVEYLAVPIWKAGYEVLCPDLPLYGLTEYKGKVSYNDWVTCAVKLCGRYRKDNLPFFTLGLSAGGMLAYQVGCEIERIDGIMATCLLDQREKEVNKRTASSKFMGTVGKTMLKFLHIPFGNLKLPMKAVCNMKAIVNNERLAEILMKDTLSSGTWVSLEFLYSMLYPALRVEPEDFNRCPVVLAHPGDDRWTDPELSRIFFDRIKGEKHYELLPGGGHFTIEEPMLKKQEEYFIRFMDSADYGWRTISSHAEDYF